jgi:nucleoside-diphosphate-sugar epimerase
MSLRIFVAGAAGVIGRRLVPMLRERGYSVTGTARSAETAAVVERLGGRPVVLDVFDATAVMTAVAGARPDVVIHQLTDLALIGDPAHVAEALRRNARIRRDGTHNLVAAARAAGVRRLIAQSIAWVYAPGAEPHGEDDALDLAAEGARQLTVDGVVALEDAVLNAAPIEGIVLRYGWLYGPGANPTPAGSPGAHVDAAAHAAVLAVERGRPGAYNIAEPGPAISIAKARRALGWDPRFRVAE